MSCAIFPTRQPSIDSALAAEIGEIVGYLVQTDAEDIVFAPADQKTLRAAVAYAGRYEGSHFTCFTRTHYCDWSHEEGVWEFHFHNAGGWRRITHWRSIAQLPESALRAVLFFLAGRT